MQELIINKEKREKEIENVRTGKDGKNETIASSFQLSGSNREMGRAHDRKDLQRNGALNRSRDTESFPLAYVPAPAPNRCYRVGLILAHLPWSTIHSSLEINLACCVRARPAAAIGARAAFHCTRLVRLTPPPLRSRRVRESI